MTPSSQPDNPFVSVVICTHNRADYLRTAIESILAQQADVPWELVVVDNRSTDMTAQICADYAEFGHLRYIHEPQLGLCHARNRGWRESRGSIIAYFDDDAIAEAGWLKAIHHAFMAYPDAGIVGGRVMPIWQAQRPSWLSDNVALSLTIVDWSPDPKPIADVRLEWLVGANLAIRSDVLEEVGGFEPRLDRIGAKMLTGGDVFLQERVIGLGHACVYDPAMAVLHLVPANRLDQGWFKRRYYWQGISDAVMFDIRDGSTSRVQRWRRAGAEMLALARNPRQLLDWLLPTRDPLRFERKCMTLIRIGFISGLLRGSPS